MITIHKHTQEKPEQIQQQGIKEDKNEKAVLRNYKPYKKRHQNHRHKTICSITTIDGAV